MVELGLGIPGGGGAWYVAEAGSTNVLGMFGEQLGGPGDWSELGEH